MKSVNDKSNKEFDGLPAPSGDIGRNGKATDKNPCGNRQGSSERWKSYDPAGNLTAIRTCQNGILVKTDEYKDGKLVKSKAN